MPGPTRIQPLYEAPHEDDERRRFLKDAVTIDEDGVARCTNRVSGTVLRLAVARIVNGTARLVPFELDSESRLVLPLPPRIKSRLCLFMGHNSLKRTIGAAVRTGPYPGKPLIATHRAFASADEILLGLHGIKNKERDEQRYANHVNLFGALDFDHTRTRVLSRRVLQSAPNSGVWSQPEHLDIEPRDPDLPFTAADPAPSIQPTVQVLGYEVETMQAPEPEAPGYLTNGARHRYETAAAAASIIVVRSLQAALEFHAVPSRTD